MKAKVSCIIPTYNEALGILIFMARLRQVLSKLKTKYQFEIVIIDDNSPDWTSKIIEEKYKNDKTVRVFVRKKERGLGTAINYGIRKAKGEIIVGIDADGNHDMKRISLLLDGLKNNDLVVASRFVKSVVLKSIFSQLRHFGSFLFNAFLKFFFGFPVWDNTSGFYAISKEKLQALGLKKIYYGYGDYHLRLVYLAKLKKYKIKEIPCVYPKRIAGRSKSRLLRMFFTYLREGLRLRFD